MKHTKVSRRRLLASVPIAAAIAAPATAAALSGLPATGADPAFAAFETHKRATDELEQACWALEAENERTGQRNQTSDQIDEAHDRIHEAIDRLATTAPTTPAGASALISYVCKYMDEGWGKAEWYSLAMHTVADALLAMKSVA